MSTEQLAAGEVNALQEAARVHERNAQVAIIVALLAVDAPEEAREAVVVKFQEAYDALFAALGGRPNGEGAADVQH